MGLLGRSGESEAFPDGLQTGWGRLEQADTVWMAQEEAETPSCMNSGQGWEGCWRHPWGAPASFLPPSHDHRWPE